MSENETADIALTQATVLRRSDDWLTAQVGEELVMMDAATGDNIGLTETGRRIWELLAQPQRFSAVCDALAREYNATSDQIAADAIDFVRDLIARRALLIEAAG